MKKLIIALTIIISSCNTPSSSEQTESKRKELKIVTRTAHIDGDKTNSSEVISIVDSDYFEVSLSSITQNGIKRYIATKKIQEFSVESGTSISFNIVENDSTKFFNSSTEFLNYLSERGYEMVTQNPNKYGGDYTFKRKD